MTIVILGAGDIGTAVARQIAAADLVKRVVLVDEAASVAAGKALDIAQAAPVDRYATRLEGTGDVTAVAGAAVIIVADRAGSSDGEWAGDAGLTLVGRVAGYNPAAPIVCAGSWMSAVIERATGEGIVPRTRVFGSAPEALRASIVSLVALEAAASPAEISLMAVGRAPDEIIVPWEAASIAGRRAIDVLTPPAITRLEQRVPRLWPPGPTALGGAAARVIRSMLAGTPQVHALQVALTRTEGLPGRSAILPARVHRQGLIRVEPPPLTSRDQVRLDTTLAR